MAIILSISLAGSLCCGFFAVTEALADEVSETEEELTQTQQKLAQSQSQIEDIKDQINSLKSSLDEYEDDVEGVNAQLENIEAQIENKNAEIVLVQSQIDALEESKSKQYDTMKTRVKYSYENGIESYLQLLLESRNLSELLNRAEYIVAVRQYDERIMDEYNESNACSTT